MPNQPNHVQDRLHKRAMRQCPGFMTMAGLGVCCSGHRWVREAQWRGGAVMHMPSLVHCIVQEKDGLHQANSAVRRRCYALSQGSLDPEFGFGFGVPETRVGLDGASVSGSLCQLDFRVLYLAMGAGHAVGHDGEASDWMKGDDNEQRLNTKGFIQQ